MGFIPSFQGLPLVSAPANPPPANPLSDNAAPSASRPTPSPSGTREGSEACRAAGKTGRSGAGPAAPADTQDAGSSSPPRSDRTLGKMPRRARAPRHDEWTREKMVAFLRELAACQNVSQAAKSVGMGRQSAYKLRNRLAGTPFSLAWEVALEAGLQQLAHAVMDRALNGEEVPHYHRGELVGTSRKYDNRLAAWLLNNPWKVGRHQLAREHVSRGLHGLIERIEAEGPGWEPDGYQPNPERLAEQRAEDEDRLLELVSESWYEAHPASPSRKPED